MAWDTAGTKPRESSQVQKTSLKRGMSSPLSRASTQRRCKGVSGWRTTMSCEPMAPRTSSAFPGACESSPMKRVGIAGLLHESNTFLPVATTRDHFEQASLAKGAAVIERWEGSNHELGGFLEGAKRFG